MPERQVTISDTLYDTCSDAWDEVKDLLIEHLDENPDEDGAPCLFNTLDYSGSVHEIVDGAVPIYTSEIEDTWYMHASELEEAYENAGVGENPRENNGMAAIYYYIHDYVATKYHTNSDEIFEDWRNAKCFELIFNE